MGYGDVCRFFLSRFVCPWLFDKMAVTIRSPVCDAAVFVAHRLVVSNHAVLYRTASRVWCGTGV